MSKRKTHILSYFAKNFSIVLGLVLIWRGMWYVLDELDLFLFNGNHLYTVIGGVIIGFLILYLPDDNLDEIQKL